MVTFFLDDRPAPKKWFDMHWRPQNPCILSRMIIIIYKRQRERIVKQRKNRIFYQTNKDNCVIIYLWKRESEQSLVWSGDKALETGGAGHGCQGCLAPAEFLYSNVWHPLILAISIQYVAALNFGDLQVIGTRCFKFLTQAPTMYTCYFCNCERDKWGR